MARPKKAGPDSVDAAFRALMAGEEQCDVAAIVAGVEAFKAKFPHDWEALRLCPLQHGIETIVERLSR